MPETGDLLRYALKLATGTVGSAPLLIARGLTESLAGRFETLHLPHWPFAEMREAFGWSLDEFLLFYSAYASGRTSNPS